MNVWFDDDISYLYGSFGGAGIVPAEETPPKVEKQAPIDWFHTISMLNLSSCLTIASPPRWPGCLATGRR